MKNVNFPIVSAEKNKKPSKVCLTHKFKKLYYVIHVLIQRNRWLLLFQLIRIPCWTPSFESDNYFQLHNNM